MTREPIGRIVIKDGVRVEWNDDVTPRERVVYAGRVVRIRLHDSTVDTAEALGIVFTSTRPDVYEYETPLPHGYRRLPNGAVVCVSLVGSIVSVPEIDHGCGLTSPAHVRVEAGRHTVVVDGYTQAEVEEALWGEL